MNRLVMTFAALLGLLGLRAAERDFTQYVNPLMGTQSSFELSAGNTYPVTALPWGMNFWTPQTGKMGDGWQYTYTANRIRGFKQTHQPSPWINDFGQFSLMPVTGSPEFDEDRRASWFSHKGETSRPYYYKVYLAEHDVVAEMAPTERAALFRFTFPETEQAYVVVDAFDRGSSVRIIPGENKVVGYSTRNSGGVPAGFRNYFVMVFDRPFEYRATFADSVLTENVLEQTAGHAGGRGGLPYGKGGAGACAGGIVLHQSGTGGTESEGAGRCRAGRAGAAGPGPLERGAGTRGSGRGNAGSVPHVLHLSVSFAAFPSQVP